jgi:hypothetical protein
VTRRLVEDDDPQLRAHMHGLVERAYANKSPEERAAAHWRVDNPPPRHPVGSPEWIEKQAQLHLFIERARARRAAERDRG